MPTSSKNEDKKISDARQQSLDTNNNKPDTDSITQKSDKHAKTGRVKHLTINSRTLTLALKFYPEQLLNHDARQKITDGKGRIDYSLWTDGDLLQMTREHLKERIENFSTYYNRLKSPRDKKKRHWQVEAIFHNRDEVADPNDMFQPSIIKPHFHVIIRDANNNRFFVKTILKCLDLKYEKSDSELFYYYGCDTVGDFNAYSVYLTHDTEKAIHDGKAHYELEEVMSNMTLEEIKQIRAGYKRLQAKSKLTEHDWNQLAEYVGKLGDKMEDFDQWATSTLTFAQRTSSKFVKLQELYNKHLLASVEQSPDLVRCCILISGNANDGKSYTARHALQNLHENVYNARQGSGKYDGLGHEATAMIFDDRKMTDALNVTDNRATVLHSRGTGNDKPWLGRYVVITTNYSADDFFRDQVLNDVQVKPLESRFYITTMVYDNFGRGNLELIEPSIRGSKADIETRNKLYMRFADEFNKLIKNYHPLTADDAPKVDDKYYKHAPEQSWNMPKEGQLLNEITELNHENATTHSKLRDMITFITRATGQNWLYYTASLDSKDSVYFEGLYSMLKQFPLNTPIYRENEYQSSSTVGQMIEYLDSNYTYKFDCEYIRIGH